MSWDESDARFPHQSNSGQPPSPTRENPGAVYPRSSPTAAKPQEIPGSHGAPSHPRSVLSNPFEFQDELNALESALDRVINAIGREMPTGADAGGQRTSARFYLELREKFELWKREVVEISTGQEGAGRSGSVGVGRAPDIGNEDPREDSEEQGLFND